MLNKSKRVFVSSFNFPPRLGGESIVTYKLLKASNLNFDVYSCTYSKKRIRFNVDLKNVVSFRSQSVITWPFKCVNQFYKNKNQYSIILSRSMPAISHIPALIIKLFNPSIIWVASFSDPIANSPFKHERNKYEKNIIKKIKNLILDSIEYIIEYLTIKYANQLIFTNIHMKNYILGSKLCKFDYKSECIPFGFDEEIFNSIELNEKENSVEYPKIISHIGSFYGSRSPIIIFESLKILNSKIENLDSKIKIMLVGNAKMDLNKYIEEYGVNHVVEIISEVPYEKSLEYMLISDYLFLIDSTFDNISPNIFVPSKLYDYIGAKKPIISITDNLGPTAEIMQDTNNTILCYDANVIANYLESIINKESFRVDYEKYEKYSIRIAAEKFDNLLKSLK